MLSHRLSVTCAPWGFAQKVGFGPIYWIFNHKKLSIMPPILNLWAKPLHGEMGLSGGGMVRGSGHEGKPTVIVNLDLHRTAF